MPVIALTREWPAQLRGLVGLYGETRVYEVGLRVLKFPPTWAHATAEAELVLAALERDG